MPSTDERTDTYANATAPLIRVAFQGELGAYGDQAILQRWKGAATPVPSASFEHVAADVAWGLADFGVIPVWNTVVGEIVDGCSAVQTGRRPPYHLNVIGDAYVVVRHLLLGLKDATLSDIERVSSHPAALAQCGRFLASHRRMQAVPMYDTAGAARDLALGGSRSDAAIAGRIAAKRYGLSVLATDIQDVPDNVTHFLVLGRAAYQGASSASPGSEIGRW
jgi:prephenate dehydratase